jgi:hypothetical protein
VHPLEPAPKTAILVPGFQEARHIRVFPEGWTEQVQRFRPSALAATIEQLRRIARYELALRHAVIVLTYGAPALAEEERDFLWEAFGVPVFEQCLGPDNELLAAECEAHDGLHIFQPWSRVALDRTTCACGSTVPRLAAAAERLERVAAFA